MTCVVCDGPLRKVKGSPSTALYCSVRCKGQARRAKASARALAAAGVPAGSWPPYGRLGVVEVDIDGRQECHLCGRSWESLATHIPRHGLSNYEYREQFGLALRFPLKSKRMREMQAQVGHRVGRSNLLSRPPEVRVLSCGPRRLQVLLNRPRHDAPPPPPHERLLVCLRGHQRRALPSGAWYCPTCYNDARRLRYHLRAAPGE